MFVHVVMQSFLETIHCCLTVWKFSYGSIAYI